jgi:hypothetical protein
MEQEFLALLQAFEFIAIEVGDLQFDGNWKWLGWRCQRWPGAQGKIAGQKNATFKLLDMERQIAHPPPYSNSL